MKVCHKCKLEKTLESFTKSVHEKDNKKRVCKDCCRVTAKAYRQRIPLARFAANQRDYRERNLVRVRERNRVYELHRMHNLTPEQKARHLARRRKRYAFWKSVLGSKVANSKS